ncbi:MULTISPECIES: Gfo/Idh/MocA family protein [Streptomyces]|uniref:Inositol 2-dehydrogenase n=1 Tax=Streptomyces harbinensis TaxID=1176198 RepID=A0A1I6UUX7_9ACTN|nr:MULTISPECIES: Gfo/Idh/MocA family oxidoreductase [Streptomyces]SFT05196.1 myo-inositol 2-dehydrogenase / D-chiro-inositol 1-dehydrogenase [Streptomyces harbinensis]
MNTENPLGIAVIGTGRMGADHVRRIDRVISGAYVAAVADVDEGRAKEVAGTAGPGCTAHTDPAAAMDAPGVGAVLIASPGAAHEAQLLAALERDLPVLCEKPLTPDPEAALRVMAAEEALGHRRIQVGFMRRYDHEYRQLKHLLADGRYGRPLMLHCRHRNTVSHPLFTTEMLINDSVVHEMDAARWLLEQELTAVTVLRPVPSSGAPDGLGDPQLVIFETSGGALVDVEIFVNCGFGYQVQAEAVCERGTARIGDAHGLLTNTAGRWGGEIADDFIVRFADAYDRQLREWVDATRAGRVTGPSAWDGYAAAAVCAAGVAAQRSGVRTPVEMAERPAFYSPVSYVRTN